MNDIEEAYSYMYFAHGDNGLFVSFVFEKNYILCLSARKQTRGQRVYISNKLSIRFPKSSQE